MSTLDDEFVVRPGRIRNGGRNARAKSFVDQVTRAAQSATQGRRSFTRGSAGSRSTFGRGRTAVAAASLRSSSRRVVIKARVVRHRGQRFHSASLATHVDYLKRDGVSRDGEPAQLFDAQSDDVDGRAFAESCEPDRHHFRFIVSPEDGAELSDLRAFTRDLLGQASTDLGCQLEWAAVPHWNTDNPHVHVLVRGRADGADLVISRDYISRGLRGRAEELVGLELGPRSEQAIARALQNDVEAERWTGLDRALQAAADENGGTIDLRLGGSEAYDTKLKRLMIGRAMKLERLGLAEGAGSARWLLRAGAEATLRELSIRGDIIKTMHSALARGGRDPSTADFAIHGDEAPNVIGRLADRGLYDELTGSAYVVIEGLDGRSHYLTFADLNATSDAATGAIVEARPFVGGDGKRRLTLSVRSDFSLADQVGATGATWLDGQLVAREPNATASQGYGAEVREALIRRTDHLASSGLATRQGQRSVFARNLLDTLRRSELDEATRRLSISSGLPHRPGGEGGQLGGVYRQRVDLASGRFAMLDNGLGFELVPWKPSLESHLGRQVRGVRLASGGIDWSMGRSRGPSIG